jgi:uncharacterized protein (TIGR03546 family)
MLRMLAKLLKVLNSETEPGQISLAFCFAMVIGLTPLLSVHNILVVLLVLLLRVNLSAFILGWGFFSGLAYLLDPLFHRIGLAILTAPTLEGFWTTLYNVTFWRLVKFNNSIVIGSLLFSVALFIPLYLLSNLLIRRYRDNVLAWVQKSRLMQAFKANKFYSLYQSLSGLGGAS